MTAVSQITLTAEQKAVVKANSKACQKALKGLEAVRATGTKGQDLNYSLKDRIITLAKLEILQGKKDPSKTYPVVEWQDTTNRRMYRIFLSTFNKAVVDATDTAWGLSENIAKAVTILLENPTVRTGQNDEPLYSVSAFNDKARNQLGVLAELDDDKEQYFAHLLNIRLNPEQHLDPKYLTDGKVNEQLLMEKNQCDLKFEFSICE